MCGARHGVGDGLADRVLWSTRQTICIGTPQRCPPMQMESGPTWAKSTGPPGVRMTAVAQQVSNQGHHVATRSGMRSHMPDRICIAGEGLRIWRRSAGLTLELLRAGRTRPAGAGHRAGRQGPVHSENRREWLTPMSAQSRCELHWLACTRPIRRPRSLSCALRRPGADPEDQEQVTRRWKCDQVPDREDLLPRTRGIRYRYTIRS